MTILAKKNIMRFNMFKLVSIKREMRIIMFVSAINNFNQASSQNNKTSFKSLADAELFKKVVEDIPKLKHGLTESVEKKESYPLYSVLHSAYQRLKEIYADEANCNGFKVSLCPRGMSGFSFRDMQGRRVRISLQSANPGIFYYEEKTGLFGKIKDFRDISYTIDGIRIKRNTKDERNHGALRPMKQDYNDYLFPDGDGFISESKLPKNQAAYSPSD